MRTLALGLMLFAGPGCGTIFSHTIGARRPAFGGVAADAVAVALPFIEYDMVRTEGLLPFIPLLLIGGLADLPLSLVGDLVMLPADLSRCMR